MDDQPTNYSKFKNYLYDNKMIKKNSDFATGSLRNENSTKKLIGWEDLVFEVTEDFIKNISTTNYEFTAFIITTVQKEEDEVVENLILFYNEVLENLKIKKINKKYKIKNEYGLEYAYSDFFYVSPHKPDTWYID